MPEFDMRDQVRAIGARICRFANGAPCLCAEKDRPLCKNVREVALELHGLAHKTEMTRQEHNEANRFGETLEHGQTGRKATKSPRRIKR